MRADWRQIAFAGPAAVVVGVEATAGAVNVPVVLGAQTVHPGDVVVAAGSASRHAVSA